MSRRIRPKPEFAVAQAVEELKSKFEYPDQDIPPAPFELGGGGGAPSVVVAASDASDLSKSKADYICPGVNDDQVIQAAMDVIGSFGRVLLTEGSFNIALDGINLNQFQIIQGLGVRTILTSTDTSGNFITGASQNIISDLRLVKAGAGTLVGIELGNESIVRDCVGEVLDTMVAGNGSDLYVTGCIADSVGVFFEAQFALERVHIVDNKGVPEINLAGSFYTQVSNNNLIDQIVVTGGASHVITDNLVVSSANGPVVDMSNATDSIVSANIGDLVTQGLLFDSCDRVQVTGNLLGAEGYLGEHGIVLDACTGFNVHGNTILSPGADGNDTYDGVHLSGASDENFIHGNTVTGSASSPQPRYAYNDTTSGCNRIVGNNGDGQYASGNINAGANTILDWPNDPTDGDNIFGCDTSPTSP